MFGDKRTVNEIPIYQECPLQTIYRRSTNAQMRIAPRLFGRSLHVSHGDIHTADESHQTINDTYLAVIAIVNLSRKHRETNGHKCMNVDSRLSHSLKEGVLHFPTSHIIVNDTNLYALFRLGNQRIGYQTP